MILRRSPEQKHHVTRNSRNWLVTTWIGACCFAQNIARVHNVAAYCLNAKHPRDICLSKYVKVCFIWTIITTVTEFLSLVTQNSPTVCILNKLTLQKELQNVVQLMCFGQKGKNSTTTKQKIKIKTLTTAGNRTRDILHPKRMRYHCPANQLRVSIVVKLFNCFDAMGRNVNKQSRICGPHTFNKFIFSVIF